MFAIRQKSTGAYLPHPPMRYRGGGTHVVPTLGCLPRFFPSRGSAKCALTNWLMGKQESSTGYDMDGNWDSTWSITPVPDRDPNDMEVVEIEWKVK